MRRILITETTSTRVFIKGYSESPRDKVIEIPDGVGPDETTWLDEYGNPKWEILLDGSIVLANIEPSVAQLEAYNAKILGKKKDIILEELIKGLDDGSDFATILANITVAKENP